MIASIMCQILSHTISFNEFYDLSFMIMET